MMKAPTKQRRGFTIVGHEDEPLPRYDWKQQLGAADNIIERSNTPELTKDAHRETLAQLLADLHETYDFARDDFDTRHGATKPFHEKLEKNYESADTGHDYDYGDLGDAALEPFTKETWAAYYRKEFTLGRGNPGTARKGGAPTVLVYGVYHEAALWWRKNVGSFCPRFMTDDEGDPNEDKGLNPEGRFVLGVLQYLDPRYNSANAASLDRRARNESANKAKKTE